MRHCPNPECSHRRAHHVAAEFRDDIAVCSDCRTALVEGEAAPDREAESTATPFRPDLWGRAALTAIVPTALMFVLGRMLLPGIDSDALAGPDASAMRDGFSFGALGVAPILEAFVVVEIAAAVVPRWRGLRTSGRVGRVVLDRAVALVAALFAGLRGFALMLFAESFRTMDGIPLIPEPSWTNRLLVVATVIIATGAIAVAARAVSRYGVLNGYAAFVALALVQGLAQQASVARTMLSFDQITPLAIVVAGTFVGLFVVASWRLLRTGHASEALGPLSEVVHFRAAARRESPMSVALQVPTSGVVPISILATALALPVTLRNFGATWVPAMIDTNTPRALVAQAVALAALAVVLGRAFQKPTRIAALAGRATGSKDGGLEFRTQLEQGLRRTHARTIALVVLCALAAPIADRWIAPRLIPSGVVLATLVAIALDALDEWRARARHANLQSIWVDQRSYGVQIATHVLTRDAVPSFVRGTHYRALLQFFGPYVPLEVMVRPVDVDRASETVAGLLGDGAG